jgi:hypothetical protein
MRALKKYIDVFVDRTFGLVIAGCLALNLATAIIVLKHWLG